MDPYARLAANLKKNFLTDLDFQSRPAGFGAVTALASGYGVFTMRALDLKFMEHASSS